MRELKYVLIERICLLKLLFSANLSNMLMCVLLHLFICAALRAHVIVAEALYKVNYYYYYYYCYHHSSSSLLYKFLNSIAPVYLTELNPDSLQTNPPAIPLF